MDNQLRNIFFQLLRIGLWGKGKLLITNPLKESDWNQIFAWAIPHTVEGIIYDSFALLEEDQLPPQSLRLKWTVRVDQIERHNIQMNQVIASQYNAFTRIGIQPILQKGQGVAQFYLNPLHRICGDIDWHFEDNGYATARNFIKEKGITVEDTKSFSLHYNYNNQFIEHHKQLFDLRNPLIQPYLRNIAKHYREKQGILKIEDVSVRILAPELQLFQVNSHILKHLITFGMGLRQFCDSARLYAHYNNQIDSDALKKIYQKTGILKWSHLLHRILVDTIGLPKSYLPFAYPKQTDSSWMLEEIWFGGNFGYYDERYADGKINSTVSVHPDGAKRLWRNFKRYLPYAPQETIFFPIMHFYSKFLGIDRD
ncbi:nucleotidyltransferase family protein [Sphingobacterium sp. NGMCC 1.201703]|uniref:nucleotidyltransferase domain-containing protein n=1 Tax=Sphingobacterium sp. NGMCC 1.201703 TaxID=3388657 RepID=UPI0039FC2820